MILSPNERCPIHRNYTCECHRVQSRNTQRGVKQSKWETIRFGVRRIKDKFADHPDGYRYKLSKVEMRKVLLKKIEDQSGLCALCGKSFETLLGIQPDHRLPKGMNSARCDDRPENIQAAHDFCNAEKGSIRSFGSAA
jgi:hypothetical protein